MPHFSLFWKLEILFLAFSCLIVKCLVWLWEKLSCLWFVQLPEYVLSFCFCQIWRLLRCNVFEYAFMLILFSSFLKLWCYDWWYFCYGHIQIPEAPFCFLIFKKKKSEILISLVQIGWILLMCPLSRISQMVLVVKKLLAKAGDIEVQVQYLDG